MFSELTKIILPELTRCALIESKRIGYSDFGAYVKSLFIYEKSKSLINLVNLLRVLVDELFGLNEENSIYVISDFIKTLKDKYGNNN